MSRPNNYPQLVLASNNSGKVREFNQLLASTGIEVLPQAALGISDAIEDGLSFVENAIKKARHAARHSGLPAIADDSGLEIDALNGRPGIYSARFAGDNASDQQNVARVLEQLAGIETDKRGARFRCLLVYMRHAEDPTPCIFQGTWEGQILLSPQGENGFGYDPIFYVKEAQCSAAEMSADQKNRVSHRGQVLHAFREHWNKQRA